MCAKNYITNREVSWLRFNERVLDEASANEVPLLEKLKFISIFVSNLDEFFMIRIGSLTDLSLLKKPVVDSKTGMTPAEQIEAVVSLLPKMYDKKDRLYRNVSASLKKEGVNELSYDELSKEEIDYVRKFFDEKIREVASAQIVDVSHPFPFLENKRIYVVSELKRNNKKLYGFIPIKDIYPDYIIMPGNEFRYILTEQVILNMADTLFPGYIVESKTLITVTRNFDLTEDAEAKDEFDDYKEYMKAILKKRKRLHTVRLEAQSNISKNVEKFLLENLELSGNHLFVSNSPMKMAYVFDLINNLPSAIRDRLTYDEFAPYRPFEKGVSIIKKIFEKDVLLSYPYDDVETFIDLLKEASENPECISIKITIYRLAKASKIAKYLIRAAENGKEVTVLMELKARFDEERNIEYSNLLYEAGCNIIYGFDEYKTHSKLMLLTFKNKNGGFKYITQVGTGNYNESTAKLYTDFCLMSSDKELALDAVDFFKNMALGNLDGKYVKLLQSPTSLKIKLTDLIDKEIAKGENGRIFCKFNSFTDKDLIEKFQEASAAGVKIRLIIRGISCLLPGVENYTENIETHSIVGRFLEHSRIYAFGDEDPKIYISSADLMTRNMDRRVEIAAPIEDPELKERLLRYMEIQFSDKLKGRRLRSDGKYEYMMTPEGEKLISSQDYFLEEAKEKNRMARARRRYSAEKEESFFERIKNIFKKHGE